LYCLTFSIIEYLAKLLLRLSQVQIGGRIRPTAHNGSIDCQTTENTVAMNAFNIAAILAAIPFIFQLLAGSVLLPRERTFYLVGNWLKNLETTKLSDP
jgi:hypothetical protein